jgi:hypothetical protein
MGKEKGWFGYPGGNIPNKATQFGQPNGNPRRSGSWHKEDTARYKMETIMKMSDEELEAIREDKEKTSFERAFANVLYLSRTATNIEEAQKCMVILEKMVNQVYGQMPQVQVAVEADEETQEEANKFIRGFALP